MIFKIPFLVIFYSFIYCFPDVSLGAKVIFGIIATLMVICADFDVGMGH